MKSYARASIVLLTLTTASFAPAQLQELWSHQANGQSVAFSPDSQLLASGGGGLNVWNSTDGSLFETLNARFNDARSVAFSPTGQYIADGVYAFNQNLNVWLTQGGA